MQLSGKFVVFPLIYEQDFSSKDRKDFKTSRKKEDVVDMDSAEN